MRTRGRLLVWLLAGGLALSAGCERTASGPAADCVAIASTNDLHGTLEPLTLEAGGRKVRYGGLEVLASYVAVLRERFGARMLLLDAGDFYQGSVVSNLSEGRAVIAAMNTLGYDAATLGNHEFDFGAGVSVTPGTEPPDADRLRVVRARVAEARFPFVVVNVGEKAAHTRIEWANTVPTLLVDKGGVRVGIVGVITPDTPRVTRPQNVETLEFIEPAALVVGAAETLRAQGAKLVVLLAHMGGECERTDNPNDLSSCDADSELFHLLRELPRGTVDVAVGGHSHQLVAHWVNGVATMEAGARARNLGWIDACVAPSGGIDRTRSTIHSPVPVCLDAWQDGTCGGAPRGELRAATFLDHPIGVSDAIARVVAPFAAQVHAEAERRIGIRLPEPLVRLTSAGRTPLGDAVSEALRKATGARVAVHNRGGVRTDLPAGSLTFSMIFEALPFDNRVALMQLTGAELRAFVAHLRGRRNEAPLVSGLELGAKPDEVRLSGGAPIADDATYSVATNDFLALGGEGLARVFKAARDRTQVLDADLRTALIAYLREKYPE